MWVSCFNRLDYPLLIMLGSSVSRWHEKANHLFPGISNGEFGIPKDQVPILKSGRGPQVTTVDGRQMLDMSMAWGSAILGHAHPSIIEAATSAAQNGSNFATLTDKVVELAERLVEISPCAEKARFVASGTEATMMCLRIARAATGKAKILKFEGAYHGQHPEGVASMVGTSSLPPSADTSGTGAPWITSNLMAAPYNDLERATEIIEQHQDSLAGVIVEPLHRCLVPQPGFLEGLRLVCQRLNIVLIYDEVVTGFRLSLGGAQEYYGVEPDLVAYGKALGGGFPIGAYAGKAALMDHVDEHRYGESHYVWSASTSGGNPVSASAALETIRLLSEPGVFTSLHKKGADLRRGMAKIAAQQGLKTQILGDGPIAQIAIRERPITNQETWLSSDRAKGRKLMLALLSNNVFLNPM